MNKIIFSIVIVLLSAAIYIAPVAISKEYRSAYDRQEHDAIAQAEKWLHKYELTIMVILALFVPTAGWTISSILKTIGRQREVGRKQFLDQVTATITDSVSERLVSKLEVLEERIEWIYKEMTQFERKSHDFDNELNHIRLELNSLSVEVKLLRATRREFLARLNEQLQSAETYLIEVARTCSTAAGDSLYEPKIEKIVDPFDSLHDNQVH